MSHPRPTILTSTPVGFGPDGALDLDASRRILESTAVSGTDGAFVIGTTGEFPALSEEERQALTELSLEVLRGRRVVVHVGAASAWQVERLVAGAREAGATAVAVLTPYYLPASEEAVLEFYDRVVRAATGLEVYLYLFAARTGNRVRPELLARLSRIPGVVGAKISGEPLDVIGRYRAVVPDGFQVFTGADGDLLRTTAWGVEGIVSGVASVFPTPFTRAADALERGARDEDGRLQADIDAAVDLVRGDPERMRVGLAEQGVDAGSSRMALDPVDEVTRRALRAAADRYGLIPVDRSPAPDGLALPG